MARVKRGKLAAIEFASSSATKSPGGKKLSKKKKKPQQQSSPKGKSNAAGGNISPALSEWMEKQEREGGKSTSGDDDEATEDVIAELKSDELPAFTSFEMDDDEEKGGKKSSERRKKQSARKSEEKARSRRIEELVRQVNEGLEGETKDLFGSVLVEPLSALLDMQRTNNNDFNSFRQLTASSATTNYRLAWVGSDDALCHVCTGLHKIALARLQVC